MNKKIKKQEKGITLIALIITIILMLILLGVSVDIAVDGKLFDKAQDAVDKTNYKVGQTQDRVDELMDEMNKITETVRITIENTENEIVTDGIKVAEVVDGVPIPVGFTASNATGENTKENGLVIYEGTGTVDDSNVENARNTRNQFVWVPVIPNQTIKIKIKEKEDITGITVLDPLYNEITEDKNGNPLIARGKECTFEINPTINGIYKITVQMGENEEVITKRVSSLYAQDFWPDYTLEDFYYELEEYSSAQEKVEDYGYNTVDEYMWDYKINENYNSFTDNTVAIDKNSVNTYGGFYIARYEAGCDNARTSYNDATGTAYSKRNKAPYNYVKQATAINLASNMDTISSNENVTTCLMNLAAYNRTINWLIETNAIEKKDFADSKGWGNYLDSSISGLTTAGEGLLLNTGVSDYTKRNNIYDLAGNLQEWTTGKSGKNGIQLGGNYKGSGYGYGVGEVYHWINSYTEDHGDIIGFRNILFINI